MEKQIDVSYDKDEDMLSLFKKDRKAKFSQEINLPDGDMIIDFSSDGLVAGLEFFNASNYFPQLKKIANSKDIKARMSVKYGKNAINIFYVILMPQGEICKEMIISPYSKQLIVEN